MAQWDVYRNPSPRGRADVPYLLVLQSDLLSGLTTRLVAPLVRSAASGVPRRLSPDFEVEGTRVHLLPQETGPIDARVLRHPVISLRAESFRIVDAIDAVISGI